MRITDEEFWRTLQARRARVLGELRAREAETIALTELERLWYTCKFVVLEGDPASYFRIRELFNSHRKGQLTFEEVKAGVFQCFTHALTCPVQEPNLLNLLTHIWGFLRKHVHGEDDRAQVLRAIDALNGGDYTVVPDLYVLLDSLHFKYGKPNLLNPVLV
ncbi:DUF1722 domain-containing protein [Tumebacillus flagellatus]|uniref:DUF1722 domain-containing protein n=1 Tax=Tumebacillus flagellatus TaxID=1157490 RepID=A0A074LPN5_9BACL|nr:DUF1722 domain-containing protein [Tumebacillus flagellatus]KEO81813.1 hypothetical protein EL26_18400 [Tumebacillus flagellatus]